MPLVSWDDRSSSESDKFALHSNCCLLRACRLWLRQLTEISSCCSCHHQNHTALHTCVLLSTAPHTPRFCVVGFLHLKRFQAVGIDCIKAGRLDIQWSCVGESKGLLSCTRAVALLPPLVVRRESLILARALVLICDRVHTGVSKLPVKGCVVGICQLCAAAAAACRPCIWSSAGRSPTVRAHQLFPLSIVVIPLTERLRGKEPHQMYAPPVKPPPHASYSIAVQVALVTGERIEPIFPPYDQGSAAAAAVATATGRHACQQPCGRRCPCGLRGAVHYRPGSLDCARL